MCNQFVLDEYYRDWLGFYEIKVDIKKENEKKSNFDRGMEDDRKHGDQRGKVEMVVKLISVKTT